MFFLFVVFMWREWKSVATLRAPALFWGMWGQPLKDSRGNKLRRDPRRGDSLGTQQTFLFSTHFHHLKQQARRGGDDASSFSQLLYYHLNPSRCNRRPPLTQTQDCQLVSFQSKPWQQQQTKHHAKPTKPPHAQRHSMTNNDDGQWTNDDKSNPKTTNPTPNDREHIQMTANTSQQLRIQPNNH